MAHVRTSARRREGAVADPPGDPPASPFSPARPARLARALGRRIRKAMFFSRLTRYERALQVGPPTHIQVEVTTRCNAACIWCSRNTLAKDQLRNDLTPDVMRRILATFPGLQSIRLLGLGEIFMSPHIETLLGMLRERGIVIWAFSNGAFLGDQRVRDLIHDYFFDLTISLDSSDAEEFERIRPMGATGLADVLAGVRLLIAERDAGRSNVLIGVNSTISHTNYQALPGLGDLCIELGVDYMSIAAVENWLIEGDPDYEPSVDFVSEAIRQKKLVGRHVAALRRRLFLRGILTGYKTPEQRLGRCHWPFNSLHVGTDGTVTPCCIRTRAATHAVFNLLSDVPFDAYWNGEGYREIRRAHLEGDTSNRMCGNCPR
jgi:MoaA/NifB/PqqE/SkfB family radical SAM enzyme